MKMGMRKPSIKKSISARTTGRMKRSVKRALIPGYGRKGMGWIKNPRKAAYNKIYRKATFGGLSGGAGCLMPILMIMFLLIMLAL